MLIDVTEPVYQGALIYREAELDYEDVLQTRVEIFMRRGDSLEEAQAGAEWFSNRWEPVIIRFKPTRITSFGYS